MELGRIDINVEVSMLSSPLALPMEGHFEEILHMIFGYLQNHMNSENMFDPSEPMIDIQNFQHQGLDYSIYSSSGEELKESVPSQTCQNHWVKDLPSDAMWMLTMPESP